MIFCMLFYSVLYHFTKWSYCPILFVICHTRQCLYHVVKHRKHNKHKNMQVNTQNNTTNIQRPGSDLTGLFKEGTRRVPKARVSTRRRREAPQASRRYGLGYGSSFQWGRLKGAFSLPKIFLTFLVGIVHYKTAYKVYSTL